MSEATSGAAAMAIDHDPACRYAHAGYEWSHEPADAGKTHPPVELWQRPAGARFSHAGEGLSGRSADARRTDYAAHSPEGDQRGLRGAEEREIGRAHV